MLKEVLNTEPNFKRAKVTKKMFRNMNSVTDEPDKTVAGKVQKINKANKGVKK